MNIGLLIFLLSIAGMIGLGVYAFIDNRRLEAAKRRQFEEFEAGLKAARQAAHQTNIAHLSNLQSAAQTQFERARFYGSVLEMLELIDLVAVPISDTWREQMKPDALARFMHENAGCKLRMDDDKLVLYVPDEDTATMARLAL